MWLLERIHESCVLFVRGDLDDRVAPALAWNEEPAIHFQDIIADQIITPHSCSDNMSDQCNIWSDMA